MMQRRGKVFSGLLVFFLLFFITTGAEAIQHKVKKVKTFSSFPSGWASAWLKSKRPTI